MNLILPTPEQLQTAYERDLIPAFPQAELKPLRVIQTLWDRGDYLPYCLFDGARLAGECFIWKGKPGWALLDYLCVPASQRGRGVGAGMIGRLLDAQPDTVILGEAEAVRHAPDPEMAQRRLNFYRRTGVRFAGFDSEMFGMHYRIFYWAPAPVSDEALRREYEALYRRAFAADTYEKYVHVPWDPERAPGAAVPWDQ
ncbi:MAG: hypothetical protein LKJ80_03715 [Oscillibacter sp.]|jgi:hypothetical protein|nr:hypothetical protein [Oscillibacter sp.]